MFSYGKDPQLLTTSRKLAKWGECRTFKQHTHTKTVSEFISRHW